MKLRGLLSNLPASLEAVLAESLTSTTIRIKYGVRRRIRRRAIPTGSERSAKSEPQSARCSHGPAKRSSPPTFTPTSCDSSARSRCTPSMTTCSADPKAGSNSSNDGSGATTGWCRNRRRPEGSAIDLGLAVRAGPAARTRRLASGRCCIDAGADSPSLMRQRHGRG